MAGKTNWYNMAYFDFADRLDYSINVQREVDRFTFIDNQLYGLYSVFGSGVISGWEVFDNGFDEVTGISIGITSGSGVLKNIALQTFASEFLNAIMPSTTLYVYVVSTGSTTSDRSVNFIASVSLLSGLAVKLATIVTSENGITSIDNTDRTNIGFEQTILNAVNSHKHRGTPTKIDLEKETKNLLSGAYLESFDASKVTTGIFDQDRIPVLNHNDLNGIGIITHAQLDTFTQSLSSLNQGLLGELSTVNQLHQILFLKTKYTSVDQYFDNELAYLPAYSPDSVVDFDATSALINKTQGCIIGLPVTSNDTYFFTNDFTLPSPIKRIILSSHKHVPSGSAIIFGINTTNSVTFTDYQTITEDRLNDVSGFSNNLRIGIKFTYNSTYDPFDPYSFTFEDFIEFMFVNSSLSTVDFHFRIRFYTDAALSNLYYTAYSANDQEGWLINDTISIPSTGYPIAAGGSVTASLFPDLSVFQPFQLYYIAIDAWDGSVFTSETTGYTFITRHGSGFCDQYGYLPQVKNFACMFELEDNKKVKLNL
jgi:hypothetical protein